MNKDDINIERRTALAIKVKRTAYEEAIAACRAQTPLNTDDLFDAGKAEGVQDCIDAIELRLLELPKT